jgi:hypothetical protein
MKSTIDPNSKQEGAESPSGLAVDVLGTIVNRAYDRAKRWAGANLVLQAGLFLAGVAAIFWPFLTLSYPPLAVLTALAGAEVARRATNFKELAEEAKRLHELVSGFGNKPTGCQLADLNHSLRNELSPEQAALLKQGITYASSEPCGPRRALENLCESAWFTKHLANHCAVWVGWTFISSLVVAISLLLWLACSHAGTGSAELGAQCIAATFTFLISVGMVVSWVEYLKLAQKAKEVDAEADRLLASANPSAFEVHCSLTEYQVARASAPLIPTWIWKLYRDSLNNDWKLRTAKP